MKLNDEAVLDQYYGEVILEEITSKFFISTEGLEIVLNQEHKNDPNITKFKPENFIDHRFLEKLKGQGCL